jgi:hypothetical protein
MASIQPKIQEFLEGYAKALRAGDYKLITDPWSYPSFILSDQEGYRCNGRR